MNDCLHALNDYIPRQRVTNNENLINICEKEGWVRIWDLQTLNLRNRENLAIITVVLCL